MAPESGASPFGPSSTPLAEFYGPLVDDAPPACPACGGTACRGCGAVALDLFTGAEVVPLRTEKRCADPTLFD